MTAEHGVVRLRRTIFAPPGRVYRAWLDPALVSRWLAPAGLDVASVDVDERAGGHYHVWASGLGGDVGGYDCKLMELVPNRRIVLRWRLVGPELTFDPRLDSRVTISLREASGDATRLTLVDERLDARERPLRLLGQAAETTAGASGDEHPARDELDEIWRRYRASGERALRDRLLLSYAPLVAYVAGKIASWLPAHVETEDLHEYGLLGLIGAIERYEIDAVVSFETFAIPRIRGAIIDELRSLDWVPCSVRSRAAEIARAMGELRARHGRAASDEEVAEELGITLGELEESLSRIARARTTLVWRESLWSTGTIGDPRVLSRALAEAIGRLPDRERLVLTLAYHEGLTLREIGEVLSIGESGAAALHAKATLRLNALEWLPRPALWDGGPQVLARGESADRGWREALNRLAAIVAEVP